MSQAVAISITAHSKSRVLWLIRNMLNVLFLIVADEQRIIRVKPFPRIPIQPETIALNANM